MVIFFLEKISYTFYFRYLLIRGFHDRNEVLEARLRSLRAIKKLGAHKLDKDRPWEEGVLDVRCGQDCIPSFQVRTCQAAYLTLVMMVCMAWPLAEVEFVLG